MEDTTYISPFFIAAAFGYLMGSIPFGLVFTRLAGLGDVRSIGSGSIGATNVLRTGRMGLAALTVLFDGGKGAVAVFLGAMCGADAYAPDTALVSGGSAFIGHLFPIWLKFIGGKGFATFLGVMLAANWPVGILCCLIWLMAALLMRYSSLATLIASLAGTGYVVWLSNSHIVGLTAFMTVLIFIRHHQNVRRLLSGTEPKIGAQKNQDKP